MDAGNGSILDGHAGRDVGACGQLSGCDARMRNSQTEADEGCGSGNDGGDCRHGHGRAESDGTGRR